jgi:CHAT domain
MAMRRYADFDVLLRRVGDTYEGRVVESPVGETGEVPFSLPFTDLDLERFVLRISHARRRVRSIDSQRLAEIREFGAVLFEALFRDELGACLRRSLDRAGSEEKGLRIRLRLPNDRLAEVPWEFLYDRSTGRFLSLSEYTPVVRYIELSESLPRVQIDGPLRGLVVISSPQDYPPLDVDHEWEILQAAVSGLISSGRLEVDRLEIPTLEQLQRSLRRNEYHVLHYLGHGGVDRETGDGVLVLQDENGMSRLESGRDLSALLYDERSLQLAVLNSCEGARAEGIDPFAGTAQALVRQGVLAVLAMQFEITDESAIVFARNFYEALADGFPVDAATSAARKAVFAASRTEWGTPVLYMRAPNGELFRGVRARPATAPTAQSP